MLITLVDSFYRYNTCSGASWRVTILECFKMQMVINLAPVSLSNKKVNFYTCPRLTFLKRNTTENAYKRISEPLHFKIFWGGGHAPRPPYRLAPSALENCLVFFWSLATALEISWDYNWNVCQHLLTSLQIPGVYVVTHQLGMTTFPRTFWLNKYLFWSPNGINELLVRFEVPFNLIYQTNAWIFKQANDGVYSNPGTRVCCTADK